MTAEEELIQSYFDAFNSHEHRRSDGLLSDENPVLVDATGTRFEGRQEVRRHYETVFALMPDCRCDLRTLTGHSGRAVAESLFHGTRPRFWKSLRSDMTGARSSGHCGQADQRDPRLSPSTPCEGRVKNIASRLCRALGLVRRRSALRRHFTRKAGI